MQIFTAKCIQYLHRTLGMCYYVCMHFDFQREIFHIGENLDGVSSEFVTAKSNTEQQVGRDADL